MRILYISLFTIALLAAGFWLYTGPQRALRDIKIAADAGDVEGIRERVDVPAVKESLKEQLTSMMQQKMASDSEMKDNAFAGLGMLFAGKMVETIVDAAVTPTHLVALIKGDRAAAFDKDSDTSAKESASEPLESKADLEGSYNSFDRYTLKMLDKKTHKQTVALTMHREGLSWRLTSVQLPMEEAMKD
ncbi:MAG: DUF2939 domain-containing protein [Janthinobacterium lividum]